MSLSPKQTSRQAAFKNSSWNTTHTPALVTFALLKNALYSQASKWPIPDWMIVPQGERIVHQSTISDKFDNCRWQHGWCLGSCTGPSKSWLPDNISVNHRQKWLLPPFLIWTKSLQRMATGLDNHHPFNNMPVVELILQNADKVCLIISKNM